MRHSVLPSLILLSALAPGLRAQDIGVQVGLVKPIADLNGGSWIQGRTGGSYGGHVSFYWSGNQALVPHFDVLDLRPGPVAIEDAHTSVRQFNEQARVRIQSFGADYDFYLSGTLEEGFYLGAGLGVAEAKFQGAILLPGGAGYAVAPGAWPAYQNKKAAQFALTSGLRLASFMALEFRFSQANFKGIGVPGTLVRGPAFALNLMLEL